jgi:hypothetical protein
LGDPDSVSKAPVPTPKKRGGPGGADKVAQALENSGIQNQLSTFEDGLSGDIVVNRQDPKETAGRTRTRQRGRHCSKPPPTPPILNNTASLIPIHPAGDMIAPSEGSVETNPVVENIQDEVTESVPSHVQTLDLDTSIPVSSLSWICRSNV